MECYFDNAATTRVMERVVEDINKVYLTTYGNPSSMHRKGFEAERLLDSARDTFARILKCGKDNLIFTSGGTESNNLAIFSAARSEKRRGKHMILSAIEHAAVSQPMKYLKDEDYEVDVLSVDSYGRINLDELEKLLREDTALVSIMHVNNEIGTIEPVEEAGAIIKKRSPKCLFHVDDIQGFGKLSLIPGKCGIDFLSVSSHKLHGPKGVGLLYVSDRVIFKPLIFGGGQQKGLRSGTENVPGIVGFATAASIVYEDLQKNQAHLTELRDAFVSEVMKIEGVSVNGLAGVMAGREKGKDSSAGEACPEEGKSESGFGENKEGNTLNGATEAVSAGDRGSKVIAGAAPHIVSVTVDGVRAEVLLHALEDKGIYVSAGSACSSNKPKVSETLKAIGLTGGALESTVRFSFSIHTTMEEVDYALSALKELVPTLKKFVRK